MFEEWCTFHKIDVDQFTKHTFDVYAKDQQSPHHRHEQLGQVLRTEAHQELSHELWEMRCQASDNFTFSSCVDKTLIYTDEMWFTPNHIEEAKCILEGTETYVNVNHQNERILRRTRCIRTYNEKPWRHVLGDKQTLLNRIHYYETRHPMSARKECGKIELNPLMWLTIWKRPINAYINNEHSSGDVDSQLEEPAPAKKCLFENSDLDSPTKKIERLNARKRLAEDLLADYIPPDSPEVAL